MAHLEHIPQTMQTLSNIQNAIVSRETLNPYDITSETIARMNEMDIEKEVEKYKSIPKITEKGMDSYIDELLNSDSRIRDQIKEKVKKQVVDEKLEWEFPGMILKTFNYEKHTGGTGIPTGTILRVDTSIYTVIDFDIRDPKAKEYLKPLILEHFQGKARIIETVSGGFHIYTRDDKIWSWHKNNRFVGIYKNEQLGFDIDVFISGGLTSTVMLPGSKVRSSKLNNAIGEYKFLSHCGNSKLITMTEALEILHQKMEIEIPTPTEKEYERKSFTGKVDQNGLTEELFEAIVSCFNLNMSQIHTNPSGPIEKKLSILPIITGFMGCIGELISEDRVNQSLNTIEQTGNFTEKAGYNWERMTEKIMAKCEPAHWRVLIKIIRLYNPKDFEARIVPLLDTKLEFEPGNYTFVDYEKENATFSTANQHLAALAKCVAINSGPGGGLIVKMFDGYNIVYKQLSYRDLSSQYNIAIEIKAPTKKDEDNTKLIELSKFLANTNNKQKLMSFYGIELRPSRKDTLWAFRGVSGNNYQPELAKGFIEFMKSRVVHDIPLMEEIYSHAYRLRNPQAVITKFFIHLGRGNDGKTMFVKQLSKMYPGFVNIAIKPFEFVDNHSTLFSTNLMTWIEEAQGLISLDEFCGTVKRITGDDGSTRAIMKQSSPVRNTSIVGMNTNFANMLGLGNCTDNATIERLVIIKFKDNSEFGSDPLIAQQNYRKKVGEFIDQPNFTFSLYRYLKEDMEIPKVFSPERYFGKEKFEILKEARLHRDDDPKDRWFNDLLENYSYISLEDFKNGFDKGKYQLCESLNKTSKVRYVVQKREWFVKSYREFISNDRASESAIIEYITTKGFEFINSRAYGGRVFRIEAEKFEQCAKSLQADIVEDEDDWE